MPNRMLKETICTSCEIDSLTLEAERFFYRLIVQVDDFGRTDARLPILRAKCFPLKVDVIKDTDIKKWLDELVDIGLVQLYSVDGKPYLYFTNWDKHQQKRAKHSKYPAPDGYVISDDIICDHVISNVPEKRETRNEKREYGRFAPPAIEDIKQYCLERDNDIDAEQFFNFYQAKNWMIGKNKMKDWKAAVITWEKRRGDKQFVPLEHRNL